MAASAESAPLPPGLCKLIEDSLVTVSTLSPNERLTRTEETARAARRLMRELESKGRPVDREAVLDLFRAAIEQSRCEPHWSAGYREMVEGWLDGTGDEVACGSGASDARWPTLDPAALHGLPGRIVRTIEPHTEADPAALLLQILIAFGNLVGRGAYCLVEAVRHHANLFGIVVGDSSKSRKGTSWGHARRMFRLVDEEWLTLSVRSGLSSGEGFIWPIRDAITKWVSDGDDGAGHEEVVDPGVEDKRMLVVEGEYAVVLRVLERSGNSLSAVLRNAWDGLDLGTMTKNSPARATEPHASIIAHVTIEELVRLLRATEAANGYGNRFIYVVARRSKCLPEGGNLSDSEIQDIAREVAQAAQAARHAGLVQRDEEARKLWKEVYPELSEGRPGLVGALTSRSEAQVLRLSLLYALFDGSRVIRAEHLGAALALWDYAEASVRHVFGNRLGNPLADDILSALKERPTGLTRTNIRDMLGRHKKANEIDAALQELFDAGLAECDHEATGGRPREVWKAFVA